MRASRRTSVGLSGLVVTAMILPSGSFQDRPAPRTGRRRAPTQSSGRRIQRAWRRSWTELDRGCVERRRLYEPSRTFGACSWTVSEGGCSSYETVTFPTIRKHGSVCRGRGRVYVMRAMTTATTDVIAPGFGAPPATAADEDQHNTKMCSGRRS